MRIARKYRYTIVSLDQAKASVNRAGINEYINQNIQDFTIFIIIPR